MTFYDFSFLEKITVQVLVEQGRHWREGTQPCKRGTQNETWWITPLRVNWRRRTDLWLQYIYSWMSATGHSALIYKGLMNSMLDRQTANRKRNRTSNDTLQARSPTWFEYSKKLLLWFQYIYSWVSTTGRWCLVFKVRALFFAAGDLKSGPQKWSHGKVKTGAHFCNLRFAYI